jgi:ElaB/YqjD/DUF883 family membrane-anchored ribosome-binding protein
MASLSTTSETLKLEARKRWDKLTDEDFDAIRTNVAELATRLQARYGISAEEAKAEAEEFAKTLSDKATDAYNRAAVALDEAATKVDQVVKDNAWSTVGAALLLGGVIGYLLGLEHSRSRW